MSPLLITSHSCAADRYGLDELKRLALRKQGLQSGIQISTILASARWAYANTPDTDSKLRAHYLALIIRSRNTFKRSGTMQMEMEEGGKLFFDLFVAMCNHIVSLSLLLPNPFIPLRSLIKYGIASRQQMSDILAVIVYRNDRTPSDVYTDHL